MMEGIETGTAVFKSHLLVSALKGAAGDAQKISRLVREHIASLDGPENRAVLSALPAGAAWFNVRAPLTLADLAGRVVVLDFFTYCCANCLVRRGRRLRLGAGQPY